MPDMCAAVLKVDCNGGVSKRLFEYKKKMKLLGVATVLIFNFQIWT